MQPITQSNSRTSTSNTDREKSSPMNKIIYRPTRTTPLIFFDPARGLLELRGKSSPENAIGFYTELINGIVEFADGGTKNLVANFKLEYFNTSSSKCIFDILKKILLVEQNGNKVSINWYYETYDEDMQEAGEDYADLLGATFNYIEIEL